MCSFSDPALVLLVFRLLFNLFVINFIRSVSHAPFSLSIPHRPAKRKRDLQSPTHSKLRPFLSTQPQPPPRLPLQLIRHHPILLLPTLHHIHPHPPFDLAPHPARRFATPLLGQPFRLSHQVRVRGSERGLDETVLGEDGGREADAEKAGAEQGGRDAGSEEGGEERGEGGAEIDLI